MRGERLVEGDNAAPANARQNLLDGIPEDVQKQAAGGACGCCCLVLIILIFVSIGTIGPIQYGLPYNRFNKHAGGTVLKGGRHFVWPWGTYVLFPSQTIPIEFSSRDGANEPQMTNCRTADSLALQLSVAFQYQIQQDHLAELYETTNLDYQQLYLRLAKMSICQITTQFAGADFYGNRAGVREAMQAGVQSRLSAVYADCTALQLLRIGLPSEWENAIVNTQVQKQKALTAENQQQVATVNADIQVMVAGYQNQITVTLATATAAASATTKSADAQAAQEQIEAENEAIQTVQQAFFPPLSNAAVVQYQKLYAYQAIPNSTFLFGVQTASILKEGDAV